MVEAGWEGSGYYCRWRGSKELLFPASSAYSAFRSCALRNPYLEARSGRRRRAIWFPCAPGRRRVRVIADALVLDSLGATSAFLSAGRQQ